jgi:hypothetical protein
MNLDFWSPRSNASRMHPIINSNNLRNNRSDLANHSYKNWFPINFNSQEQKQTLRSLNDVLDSNINVLLSKYGIRKRFDVYSVTAPHILYNIDEICVWPNNQNEIYTRKIAVFSEDYDNDISNLKLPNSISVLIFGKKFNCPLTNLSDKIKLIIFPSDSEYNQPFDNLPISLLAIFINKSYKQPLDLLPSHCTVYKN